MTLQALHFLVTRRDTSKLVGHALLCSEARYISTRIFGDERLVRGFAEVPWRVIEADIANGWEKGRVPQGTAVAVALLPGNLEATHALQFWVSIPITVDGGAGPALDKYLWQQEAR